MTTYYKEGVHGTLTDDMARGLRRVKKLFDQTNEDLYITSLCEGAHMAGSYHYCGDAVDIRIPEHVTASAIATVLGSDFQVVKEYSHWHIERDIGE